MTSSPAALPGASTPGPIAQWYATRATSTEHVYVDHTGTSCTARLMPPATQSVPGQGLVDLPAGIRVDCTPADPGTGEPARRERRTVRFPEAAARALHAALGEQLGVLAEQRRLADEADSAALFTTDGAAAGHTTEA